MNGPLMMTAPMTTMFVNSPITLVINHLLVF